MSEMIERVARAMCCPDGCVDPKFCCIPNPRDIYRVRAAIAAMREPTKEMCKAGAERHMVSNLEEEAKIKYQWMIDEALKKK